MQKINWEIELAKLEREFDGRPPNPTRPSLAVQPAPRPGVSERAAALAVWVRVVLVAALAGALAVWPYARSCGPGLFAFLGACAMIVLGGVWVSVCTWRSRMAFAHTLGFGLVLAGLVAVGLQVLPRIGYAKVDPGHPLQWVCPAPPSARPGR